VETGNSAGTTPQIVRQSRPHNPARGNPMPVKFHHIHLKAKDPEKTAAWYQAAFGFTVTERGVRPAGDAFVNCKTADGLAVIISGEKKGEILDKGTSAAHLGLEHFAVATEDFEGELARLKSHGAIFLGDPVTLPNGIRFQFIAAPDDVRIEVMWFPKG
jgi:catechol 2,3-dioxygenase-like lactoylglutathione lyase family enzyme